MMISKTSMLVHLGDAARDFAVSEFNADLVPRNHDFIHRRTDIAELEVVDPSKAGDAQDNYEMSVLERLSFVIAGEDYPLTSGNIIALTTGRLKQFDLVILNNAALVSHNIRYIDELLERGTEVNVIINCPDFDQSYTEYAKKQAQELLSKATNFEIESTVDFGLIHTSSERLQVYSGPINREMKFKNAMESVKVNMPLTLDILDCLNFQYLSHISLKDFLAVDVIPEREYTINAESVEITTQNMWILKHVKFPFIKHLKLTAANQRFKDMEAVALFASSNQAIQSVTLNKFRGDMIANYFLYSCNFGWDGGVLLIQSDNPNFLDEFTEGMEGAYIYMSTSATNHLILDVPLTTQRQSKHMKQFFDYIETYFDNLFTLIIPRLSTERRHRYMLRNYDQNTVFYVYGLQHLFKSPSTFFDLNHYSEIDRSYVWRGARWKRFLETNQLGMTHEEWIKILDKRDLMIQSNIALSSDSEEEPEDEDDDDEMLEESEESDDQVEYIDDPSEILFEGSVYELK